MGMRLPVFLACAALLAGCDVQVGKDGVSVNVAEGRARDEWVRSYTLQPGGTLEIVNVNGRIEATGTSGNQIEVRAERTVREHATEAAQQRLMDVKMGEEVSASRVRIEAQLPKDGGILDHSSLTVQYTVRVPAGIAVHLKSDNGRIRLEGLSAKVTASTINGSISSRALSGPVSIDATNGDVQIDLAAVGGDVQVSTINGNVRLELPAGLEAMLEATCVNGSVDVDAALMLQESESSRRRVAGTFNGGGPRISVATVNGGIRVRDRPSDQTN